MSVMTDRDRLVVAHAIAKARGVLAEPRRDDAPPGGTTPTRADGRGAKASSANPAGSASTFTGSCVFCGGPTLRAIACAGHVDLIDLDPFYTPTITTNTNGTRRTTIPGSAAGASQEKDR